MSRSPFRTRLVQWLESRPLAYMAALVALNVKAIMTRPALGSSEVERHSAQGFVDSIEGYFADYLSVAGLRPDDLNGLSVLELGSGDSYGVALKFIQHGARRVVCTDRFKSPRSIAGETRVYRQLLEAAGSETERQRLSQAVQFTDAGFASMISKASSGRYPMSCAPAVGPSTWLTSRTMVCSLHKVPSTSYDFHAGSGNSPVLIPVCQIADGNRISCVS